MAVNWRTFDDPEFQALPEEERRKGFAEVAGSDPEFQGLPKEEQLKGYAEIVRPAAMNPREGGIITEPGHPWLQAAKVPQVAAEGVPQPLVPGNVDLTKRPAVVNPDGTVSSIRSIGIEEDGHRVVIPTVSDDGRVMSDQEAVDHYHRIGRHLGIFKTQDEADAYAELLHELQARGDTRYPELAAAEPPLEPSHAPAAAPLIVRTPRGIESRDIMGRRPPILAREAGLYPITTEERVRRDVAAGWRYGRQTLAAEPYRQAADLLRSYGRLVGIQAQPGEVLAEAATNREAPPATALGKVAAAPGEVMAGLAPAVEAGVVGVPGRLVLGAFLVNRFMQDYGAGKPMGEVAAGVATEAATLAPMVVGGALAGRFLGPAVAPAVERWVSRLIGAGPAEAAMAPALARTVASGAERITRATGAALPVYVTAKVQGASDEDALKSAVELGILDLGMGAFHPTMRQAVQQAVEEGGARAWAARAMSPERAQVQAMPGRPALPGGLMDRIRAAREAAPAPRTTVEAALEQVRGGRPAMRPEAVEAPPISTEISADLEARDAARRAGFRRTAAPPWLLGHRLEEWANARMSDEEAARAKPSWVTPEEAKGQLGAAAARGDGLYRAAGPGQVPPEGWLPAPPEGPTVEGEVAGGQRAAPAVPGQPGARAAPATGVGGRAYLPAEAPRPGVAGGVGPAGRGGGRETAGSRAVLEDLAYELSRQGPTPVSSQDFELVDPANPPEALSGEVELAHALIRDATGQEPLLVRIARPEVSDRFDGLFLRAVRPRSGGRPGHGGRIVLNINADAPLTFVAGHELAHEIRNNAPHLAKPVLDVIAEEVDLGRWQAGTRARIGRERPEWEFMGDFLGEQIKRREFWAKLADRAPRAFQELVWRLVNVLDRLIRKVPKEYQAEPYVRDVERLRDVYTVMLSDYAGLRGVGEVKGPSSSAISARMVELRGQARTEGSDDAVRDWARENPIRLPKVPKQQGELAGVGWQRLAGMGKRAGTVIEDYAGILKEYRTSDRKAGGPDEALSNAIAAGLLPEGATTNDLVAILQQPAPRWRTRAVESLKGDQRLGDVELAQERELLHEALAEAFGRFEAGESALPPQPEPTGEEPPFLRPRRVREAAPEETALSGHVPDSDRVRVEASWLQEAEREPMRLAVNDRTLRASAIPVEVGRVGPTYVYRDAVWVDLRGPNQKVHDLLRIRRLAVRGNQVLDRWGVRANFGEEAAGEPEYLRPRRESRWLPGMQPEGERRQGALFGAEEAQLEPLVRPTVPEAPPAQPRGQQVSLFEGEEREAARDAVEARRLAAERETGQLSLAGRLGARARGEVPRATEELKGGPQPEIKPESHFAEPMKPGEVPGDGMMGYAPPGARWTGDPGAYPGEPYYALDLPKEGGMEDGKAYITERELPDGSAVWEAWLADGRGGQFTSHDDAARWAEEQVDAVPTLRAGGVKVERTNRLFQPVPADQATQPVMHSYNVKVGEVFYGLPTYRSERAGVYRVVRLPRGMEPGELMTSSRVTVENLATGRRTNMAVESLRVAPEEVRRAGAVRAEAGLALPGEPAEGHEPAGGVRPRAGALGEPVEPGPPGEPGGGPARPERPGPIARAAGKVAGTAQAQPWEMTLVERITKAAEAVGVSSEETQGLLELFQVRAQAWAKAFNRPAEEWYEKTLAGAEVGTEAERERLTQNVLAREELHPTHRAAVEAYAKEHGIPFEAALARSRVKVAATTTLLDDGRSQLTLFRGANIKNLLHEAGHVFFNELPVEDRLTLRGAYDLKVGELWGREHEERFVQDFQEYLRTGEAPVPAAQTLFERFKVWLSELLRGLERQVKPEVRRVLGKMLGEEEGPFFLRRRRLADEASARLFDEEIVADLKGRHEADVERQRAARAEAEAEGGEPRGAPRGVRFTGPLPGVKTPPEAMEQGTLRSVAKKLADEGVALGRFLLVTIPQGEFVFPSPERLFRSLGPGGEELFQRGENAKTNGQKYGSELSEPLWLAWKALDRTERKWLGDKFVWAYEDRKKMPTPGLVKFAEAYRAAVTWIGDKAEDLGVMATPGGGGEPRPFAARDPATYVPHRLTGDARDALRNRRGRIYQRLIEEGKARGIPTEILWELVNPPFVTKRHGSLEHPRLADLPRTIQVEGKTVKVLEDDPAILGQHIISATRRLAIIEQFGQEGNAEYLRELAERMVAHGMDADQAEHMIPLVWRRLQGAQRAGNPFMTTSWKVLWNAVEALAAGSNLSLAVVPNLFGGHLPLTIRHGVVPAIKGFIHAWTTAIGSADETRLRRLAYLHQDLMRPLVGRDLLAGMPITETIQRLPARIASRVLRVTGFQLANRKINQAVAWSVDKFLLDSALQSIREGKSAKWGARGVTRDAETARRYLVQQLGFSKDDVERMVFGEPTEADVSRAMQKEIENVNVMNESAMARPPHIDNTLWRLVMAYTSYFRKFGKTSEYAVREVREGNVAPLLRLLFAGSVTGEAIMAARNFFKDRKREDESWWAGLYSDLVEVGALGLWTAVDYGVRHFGEFGHEFFPDVFNPPQTETLNRVATGLARAWRQGTLRPLFQNLAFTAPILDVAEKQFRRYDPDYIAERLSHMVYTGRTVSRGKQREPLQALPGRENTAKMLMERWRAMGRTDEELLERIRALRARPAEVVGE